MKKLLFFFLFIYGISWGQTKTDLRINWSTKTDYYIGQSLIKIPQFDAKHLVFDSGNNSLFYSIGFAVNQAVDEKSLVITNLSTAPISLAELGQLDKSKIPNSANAVLTTSIARDKLTAYLTFSPIIKQGESYYKITALTYDFSYAANRIASTPSDFTSISNSVLASGDFYRFYLTKSGVYKITKSFLQQLGINTTGLDPRKIKLYGNGGRMIPLKNNVPYPADLTENAIQIAGEEDGVFDTADYILFYGEGLIIGITKAKPPITYMQINLIIMLLLEATTANE